MTLSRTQDQFLKYADGDEEFADWLKKVDRLVLDRSGVGLFDLPDMAIRDWYDEGLEPNEAAELAMEE